MTATRGISPLLVFLLLGTGAFALDRWLGDGGDERRVIRVTEDQVAAIRERWVAQWGRAPTGQELAGLMDDTVKEEILYREAQRLDLDRDDPIVRRRLAQKLTFMLEDNTELPAPAAGEIGAHYAAHAGRYRVPRRTTFRHVFLNDDRRADPATDATLLLDAARDGDEGSWRQLGDPFMLLREYADRTDQEIGELFGGNFADELSELTLGQWHGPVRSAHGTHLVQVLGRTEPRTPALDEVRDRVVRDLVEARRRDQNQAALQALRERYEVRLPVPEDHPPERR